VTVNRVGIDTIELATLEDTFGMGEPVLADRNESSGSANTVATSPSASTLALLSLTRDITALISLSVEATASLVHDWFRSTLLNIGLSRGQVVRYVPLPTSQPYSRSESGRGLAIVVLGAAEGMYDSLFTYDPSL
jgi:hypothetical protein